MKHRRNLDAPWEISEGFPYFRKHESGNIYYFKIARFYQVASFLVEIEWSTGSFSAYHYSVIDKWLSSTDQTQIDWKSYR